MFLLYVARFDCSAISYLLLLQPSEGLQWETQKVRNIKGATLSYLIQHLCRCYMEECDERHFLTVFLATYRSFASSEDVLNAIIEQ